VTAPAARAAPRRLWLGLLCAGAVVWALATAITAVTRDTILVPTVIMVGSFLVPATMVAFALTRAHATRLEPGLLLAGFFAAGTLGVVLSALTETYLLPTATGTFLGVGMIEEGTKGLVVVAVASMVGTRLGRDGLILGATVGAGFASFESAGYALSAVIGHADDHPIVRIVGTELTRAVLAPFGHITWTALLAGALFAAAPAGRLRISRGVAGTFAGVVLLHAAWDATYGASIIVTRGLEGEGWSLGWPNTEAWVGDPTGGTLVTFRVVYDVLIAVNGLVGSTWAVRRWRRYGRAA
jgi:RsiW-degrading membrane proteinase PrsW (M82 family)